MNVRHQFARIVVFLGIGILIYLPACIAEITPAPSPAATPTDAGSSSHWRFLRHDRDSLRQLGGGDMVAGMNTLGEVGYELFIVTTMNDQGADGWLYFRQAPWNRPMPQPPIEYKVIDDQGITDLGQDSFADGLITLANDRWQLAAITTKKGGGTGWHFFYRDKVVMTPDHTAGSPSAAVPSDQPDDPRSAPLSTSAEPDFSTPRAAVQTLITAATARNVDLLSHCFADSAAEEFKPLRSKTATQADLDGLATLLQGATVTDIQIEGGRQATVSVKLATRNDKIELTRTSEGWRVVDF
ncbi:hypothetical protein [uncultured Lamprocystis sp.]|jgi:hypothetical protein|uniref:hypothetical protein n=1 Tax=uncultured Lamprocystis sp. TaxID=543132 RepID=UPI0025D9C555|nr:hypothetical protein [uncultured Lamprocystis sp.]